MTARPYRPGGRRSHGRLAGMGMALFLALAGLSSPAAAQASRDRIPRGDVPDFLACGSTVVRDLESGDVHSYQFVAEEGEALTVEAVDISGTIELLRFRVYQVGGPGLGSTCTGRMPMRAPATGVYVLEVRDCIGNDAGKYALNLNVVSDTEHSCGVPLACGVEKSGELEVGGQVDSYAFYGAKDEPIALDFDSTLDGRGGLEVRVFDPDGVAAFHTCGNSFDFNLPKTGRYTVLVNACLGKNTGEYTLAWRSRSCPTHVGAHSGGGGGVGVRISNDGTEVVQIAASSLSCAYNDSSGFVLDLNPPLPITNGRFSTANTADVQTRSVQVDGVFVGEGRSQLLGGMSVPFGNARCNFQWAATDQTDTDWDGWSDEQETRLGSRPNDGDSVPENRSIPTTSLFGTGVCRDYFDNDADTSVDGSDASCFGGQPPPQPNFKAFAGRHSGGAAFSVERSADGTRVTRLLTPAIGCGALEPRAAAIDVDIPITNNRFSARVDSGGEDDEAFSLAVDGVFFDGDGDGTREQALGGMSVRTDIDCSYNWWATAHVDTDGDGWGDVAERRYGSDPRPFPAGAGLNSTPEDIALPVTTLAATPPCSDGIDNDGNELADSEDPKCVLPTATPTATVPPSPTPSATPVPTHSPTPVPTSTPVQPTRTPTEIHTPAATATPVATGSPTPAVVCLPQGAVKVVRSVASSYLPGGVVDIELQVQVDEATVPNGAVVVETLPNGWTLETSQPPASSFSRETGQIRWLFVGGQVDDMTLTYRARVGLGPVVPVHICGSTFFNEPANVPRCVNSGCSGMVALPVHPADADVDDRIDDTELLAWIDRWTSFEVADQEVLDAIDLWAAQCNDGSSGCYCLDPNSGVGPRRFRPGECSS